MTFTGVGIPEETVRRSVRRSCQSTSQINEARAADRPPTAPSARVSALRQSDTQTDGRTVEGTSVRKIGWSNEGTDVRTDGRMDQRTGVYRRKDR